MNHYRNQFYLKNSQLLYCVHQNHQFIIQLLCSYFAGNLKSEAKLTVHITDLNDNTPKFWQMVVLHDQDTEVAESAYSSIQEQFSNVSFISSSVYHVDSIKSTNFTDHHHLPPVVSLYENITVGSAVLRLLADDRDAGINGTITYRIASESHIPKNRALNKHYFTIQPQSGELIVARTLPPETDFYLNITATDGGGLMDSIKVRIYVKDVNDHAPVFKKSWYNFDLKEGQHSGTVVGKVEATDLDYGNNANIVYSILQNDDNLYALPFRISERDGTITVTGDIDRETHDAYTFQITAQDSAPIKLQQHSVVDVEIHVLDVNDNAPQFYDYDTVINVPVNSEYEAESTTSLPVYYASVLENSSPGTVVTKVSANDSDFPGNGNGLLLFDIPRPNQDGGELFAIDSKDGIVMTIGRLDYETQRTYNITIVASDLGNPSLSSTALLIVNVIDVQEDSEETGHPMFAHRYYEVEVEENSDVPMKLLILNVTESYRGHRLKYSIIPTLGSEDFDIAPSNGTLFIVHSPDREKRARYNLKARAEIMKRGRSLPVMLYPLTSGRLTDLGKFHFKSNVIMCIVTHYSSTYTKKKNLPSGQIPNSMPWKFFFERANDYGTIFR